MKKQRPEQLTTLKIDKVTHSRIKQHCVDNDYYIHLFVEEILNAYLDKTKNVENKPNTSK
jgi:hypothetical protein